VAGAMGYLTVAQISRGKKSTNSILILLDFKSI
jgi:hypothetical protein